MKAFIFFFFILLRLSGFAQQEYFVFINSDNQQPFFVQIQEKTYSSSAIGHLIISKLKDSAYQITIGFPKNQSPEMDFMIRISRKDRGYQLKNMGDKGWALFDLQTLELISPLPKKNSLAQTGYNLVKKDDDFARLMARVVSDTAVLYAIVRKEEPVVVKKEEPKKEEPVLVKNEEPKKEEPVVEKTEVRKSEERMIDSSSIEKKETANDDLKKEIPNGEVKKDTLTVAEKKVEKPVQIPEVAKAKSQIKLLEQGMTDEGFRMVIADDTQRVDILIPLDRTVEPPKEEKTYANPDSTVKMPGKKDSEKKPAGDITITADTTSVGVVRDTVKSEAPKKLVLVNSDCKSFAIDSDVDKLRIKMLAETDMEDRIGVAKKIFRTKCFSTAQVKGLTELFRSDEGIYKFLESAYPFVSDTSNFKSLVTLLANDVYVKRFRTMVRLD